jgi:hypothetical protein
VCDLQFETTAIIDVTTVTRFIKPILRIWFPLSVPHRTTSTDIANYFTSGRASEDLLFPDTLHLQCDTSNRLNDEQNHQDRVMRVAFFTETFNDVSIIGMQKLRSGG